MKMSNIDLLVIGSGGAALTTALNAKSKGLNVKIVSKTYPTRSQTSQAQGGVNAVMSDSDSIESHIADTIKSSCGLGDSEAIEYLCKEAPKAMEWLDSIGVPFSRDDDSNIAQRRLGGASYDRACYAQDYTGLKILHTLYEQSIKESIDIQSDKLLLNLIVEDNRCVGATFLDINTTEVVEYFAKSVVIATGGYSAIYRGFTTNGYGSSGDGVAAAIRAGAKLSDMEFVQFHPTALKSSSILISESARGEGGYLLNSDNERFVDELQPRDIVARAIYNEIEDGKDVYLDIRHLGESKIDELLPQERKLAINHEKIDPIKELIPIKPVAHYSMGGIAVDIDAKTSIDGLYAVGECANANVHGANRLGGNSLLELIVYGIRCAESVSKYVDNVGDIEYTQGSRTYQSDTNFINGCFKLPNKIDFYDRREFLGKIMYRNCGITRNDMNLKAVLKNIRQYQSEYHFMGIKDKSRVYNTNLVEFLEFGNMLEIAEIILIGAINRCESRGAHYREDYPSSSDEYLAHSIYWKDDGILASTFEGLK
jgi:succinate dehydrogenase / fumarate reductase flavoprotein subunit